LAYNLNNEEKIKILDDSFLDVFEEIISIL
jgi:hypothetical protein